MSSVRNIAAAQVYVEPSDPPLSPSCEKAPRTASPGAPESVTGPTEFGNVWGEFVRGHLRPLRAATTRESVCLVARSIGRPRALSPDDASLVVRVLCGEPRKALAFEMGIAVSTATGRFLRAVDSLELGGRSMPLPLVLAAQCWAGEQVIPSARTEWFDHEGVRCVTLSVARPATEHLSSLTHGQQEVAQWLIEGLTRYQIADLRETSVHTVSRQFHSIYTALRVTGRYELIRRAVALHCCHEGRGPEATG